MKAEIKQIDSTDVPNLENWKPQSNAEVYFPLELTIGPAGGTAGELFQLLVATPEALRTEQTLPFCFSGRHCLIVKHYDWTLIRDWLRRVVDEVEADTWPQVARRLSRYMKWEFEDYQTYEDED